MKELGSFLIVIFLAISPVTSTAQKGTKPVSSAAMAAESGPASVGPGTVLRTHPAQQLDTIQYEGRPAVRLSNDRLELTVVRKGAIMNVVTLKDDPARVNPLWEPARLAREAGTTNTFLGTGHFPCVDGFGPVSKEEQAAGYSRHGEAHAQTFEVVSQEKRGSLLQVSLRADLPLAHEQLTRTFRLVDGETVVYVDSRLENLLGFDRPVVWAEHATIGAPYLAPGETVVDMSATECRTRPRPATQGPLPHRFPSGQDFAWPLAPLLSGGVADIRLVPPAPNFSDNAGCLMDPKRPLGWVTALNREKRLVLGYLFRTDEYPWLQHWLYYPASGQFARGMEFATMPFDVPRREAISAGKMFGTPMFRWLPAKSAITTSFLMFYSRTPADFSRVDSIDFSGGVLVIEDRKAGRRITLAVSADIALASAGQ